MSTHTPGPWTVSHDKKHGQQRISAGDQPVAVAKIEANARLIAAAPDLLAAIKEAMPHLEAYYGQGYQSAIVVNARAAIAKAEGGS